MDPTQPASKHSFSAKTTKTTWLKDRGSRNKTCGNPKTTPQAKHNKETTESSVFLFVLFRFWLKSPGEAQVPTLPSPLEDRDVARPRDTSCTFRQACSVSHGDGDKPSPLQCHGRSDPARPSSSGGARSVNTGAACTSTYLQEEEKDG